MKKLAFAVVLLAYGVAAMAACPAGTRYDCQTIMSGKQSCGCR